MKTWTKRPYVKKNMEWWNNHPGQQTNRPKKVKAPKAPKPTPQLTLPDTPASIKELATLNDLDEPKMYRLVMKFVRTGQVVRKRVSYGPLKGTPFLYAKAA